MLLQHISTFDSRRPCILDDTTSSWLTYGQFIDQVELWISKLGTTRKLVMVLADNTIETAAVIVAGLSAGHVVQLTNPGLSSESVSLLIDAYEPDCVYRPESGLVSACRETTSPLNGDDALLFSTSGTTGSPKYVRLSRQALMQNASDIVHSLDIDEHSIASGHLPLHYSFGLSILTSHLLAGASIVLTRKGFLSQEYWQCVKTNMINHLPGVPFHLKLLSRNQFKFLDNTAVSRVIQAGGPLETRIRLEAYNYMESRRGTFNVMYGQTEAAPRISCLPHCDFLNHQISVGKSMKSGKLLVELPDADGNGRVVYYGPNVMLGYASRRSDVGGPDENKGRLDTGDIGRLTSDGFLILTGRETRFAKINGLRISLDEVEEALATISEVAVIEASDRIRVYLEGCLSDKHALTDRLEHYFMNCLSLSATNWDAVLVDEIPRSDRGKVDYKLLRSLYG